MTSVLITGANRGLGLNLVKLFTSHADPPAQILATSRDPASAKELQQLAAKFPFVKILKLDVSNSSTFPEFVEEVGKAVGENGLNVLINNAGIAKHKSSLAEVTEDDYLDIYKTNLIGPVFLTKALLPLIKKAADKNQSVPKGIKRAAILNISSLLGSVSLNEYGNHLGYRESKAALNTFSRTLCYELKDSGILVLPIHPGWVRTDLGGPQAPLSIDESVSGLIQMFYGLNESHNGKLIQWDGAILPW